MTPEKQRIAIAEACGWKNCGYPAEFSDAATPRTIGKLCGEYPDRGPESTQPLPDYLNDLNAMHEAEKALPDDSKRLGYGNFVIAIVDRDFGTESRYSKAGTFHILSATAAHRAEAFLKIMGLWEDSSTPIADMRLSHDGLAEWYASHPNRCD